MKSTLFFLILLLVTYGAFAQNYACLLPGQKQYFINGNGYLRGMRIDSVKTSGNNTLYYPFHTPRNITNISQPCLLEVKGGSWLGKQVVQLPDDTWLFDNIWGDTVTIKTQAHVGDSWVFLHDTADVYYEATVTTEDTMTVMGILDSVKKISIAAYNDSGVIADSVNALQLILSKAHGFVQVFDLYTFPYHTSGVVSINGNSDLYSLLFMPIGDLHSFSSSQAMSLFTQIHFVSPTVNRLSDYHTGDILEWGLNDWNNFGWVDYYDIDTITSNNNNAGGVSYGYNGWLQSLHIDDEGAGGYAFYYTNAPASGQLQIDTSLVVDTTFMPEETGNPYFYYYWPTDTDYCMTGAQYYAQNMPWDGNSFYGSFQPNYEYYIYKQNIGLIEHTNKNEGGGEYQYKLVYWKINGVACGSHIPLGVPSINKLNSAKIYPNPAADQLTISFNGNGSYPYQVSMTNVVGQIVYKVTLKSQDNKIAVGSLSEGMYVLRIQDSNGGVTEQKVVIAH